MAHIEVNGAALNVVTEGNAAAPPVLLLHGLGSSVASLAVEIALLAPSRRVVALDARGHGGSSRPAAYTMADHIADALGVMDALGMTRTAILGRSMGSYVAQGIAIAEPERVSELVLVVPRAHAVESNMARLRRHHAAELAGHSPAEQRRIVLGHMMAPSTPARKAALLALLATTASADLSPEEEAAAIAATARFDFRQELPKITARTLVISGRHDWLNPPEEGATIADAIPAARHVVLESAGHLPALEDRDRYLAEIAAFLVEPHLAANT